ncbi:MAG TPA: DNA-directed RNA polymerase subunit omega [Halanaerobiales bacterium]|nr:DNA-directed RNA polymerase subunit omega [Halanaerobiales bacterium]
MITYPSMDELLKQVDSPYTLVIMAARRARQLNVGGNELKKDYKSPKPVSQSLEEIVMGKVTYRKNTVNAIK